jgi:F0F1-type ATP synthase membrane subunit a
MPSRHGRLRQGLVVCLLIAAGFGGIFALTMLVGAVTGKGFAGSLLLGGFGLLLLLVAGFVFVLTVMYWRSSKSD